MTFPYPSVKRVLETPLPAHLFHYTSPAGLIGIAESQCIWATETSFLNDAKEKKHAYEYLYLCAYNYRNNMYRDQYTDDEKTFLSEIEENVKPNKPGVFVSALTEQRDQLSQWRAYCPSDGGYSIGFPSLRLKDSVEKQGFILSRCVYDHKTQHAIVAEIINHYIALYRKSARTPTIIAEIFKDMSSEMNQISAIFKHRAFAEEKEWRIITPQIQDRSRFRFRSSRMTVVPYIIVNLGNDISEKDRSLPIKELFNNSIILIVGPSERKTESSYACQMLLENHFSSVAMGSSEAPYRVV